MPESYAYKLEQVIEWMREHELKDDGFVGFKDYEIQRMERNLAWMREPQTTQRLERDHADFYRFFNEHDKRRGTDFLASFGEMKEFWGTCQYHAKTK